MGIRILSLNVTRNHTYQGSMTDITDKRYWSMQAEVAALRRTWVVSMGNLFAPSGER